MKLTYIRDMSHNYMVPECEEEIQGDDYRVCMLTENKIRGLLPCTVRKQNGKTCFYYDITSRQSLAYVYGRGGMGEKELLALLRGLYYALKEVKKFLLDTAMLVLEPELIYMDVETKEPVFCYLPGFRKEITQSFQELTGYLLEHIAQTDEKAVLLGYDIYRKSREENYSLEKILKGAGEEMLQRTQQDEPSEYGSGKTKDLTSLETFVQTGDANSPVFRHRGTKTAVSGKAVPRETVMPGKKEAGLPGKIPERKMPEREMPWQETATDAGRQKKKKPPKEKAAKKNGSAKTVFIVGVVLVVVLCAAAVLLWELDTVQIGGVAFLLTGALAYGCAVDSKNKKKQKDEDGPQLKKQPHMPDMGALQEEAYWRGERYAGGWEEDYTTEGNWRPAQVTAASRFAQASATSQPTQKSRTFRSSKGQAAEVFGDTASLPDEEETDSVAALVSMGAEYREPIILTEDEYVVGKLRSQADIVLDHHSISRVHAKILRRDGVYCLCDLNSTNGTFHNGRRLEVNERVPLQTGDEIAFARIGFYVGRC